MIVSKHSNIHDMKRAHMPIWHRTPTVCYGYNRANGKRECEGSAQHYMEGQPYQYRKAGAGPRPGHTYRAKRRALKKAMRREARRHGQP